MTADLTPRTLRKTNKSSAALFLQGAIVLIGIATLGFLLWEPHIEGRNAHASTFEIYFKDPFLAYVYVGSTPFFVALYRAFGLFGHVRQNRAFSQVTVDALRTIKRCAIAIIGFVAVGVVFIIMFGDEDGRHKDQQPQQFVVANFLEEQVHGVRGAMSERCNRS